MKKLLILSLVLCLFGCSIKEAPSGSGISEITGSIAYFYDGGEAAIEAFHSSDSQAKELQLSKGAAYTIELAPSFRGSRSAVYTGDCAEFAFADGSCELSYAGESSGRIVYELVIKAEHPFDLTITVDSYTQIISIDPS